MSIRLTPYGLADYLETVSKVGKLKTARRLAARMPSPEIAAKVGLGDTMVARSCRVVRRNARV